MMIRDLPLLSASFLSAIEGSKQTSALHLAVLTVAASIVNMRLFTDMDLRLRYALADTVFVTGRKMFVLRFWYRERW
jgi:hypothetical protein